MELREQLQRELGAGYRIERELGGGGMSRVFLAEETALGRRVVIKLLPPEAAVSVNADRFRREMQMAASLQHPHIVPLLSTGASDGLLWYSMPFVEGESLRGRLVREGELPVDAALRIWVEVLDALSYAHSRGLVHRDIKPENILLSGRHAQVTDFGVAKALASATGGVTMTGTGLALGTPAYMAPEQAAADPSTDHRADIYAAGLVMYEMLTGHGVFPGLAGPQLLSAHAIRTPEHVTSARPAVPTALGTLVMRCLEKRAADRPQRADEVLTALQTITTPGGALAFTSGGSDPAPTATRGSATGATRGVQAPGQVASTAGARGSWSRRGIIAAAAVVTLGGAGYVAREPLTSLLGKAGIAVPGTEMTGAMRFAMPDTSRRLVFVLPVEGDSADRSASRTLDDALRTALRAEVTLVVPGPEEIAQSLGMMGVTPEMADRDTLVELGRSMGARMLVSARIRRAGTGYLLTADVRAAAKDTAIASLQESASDDAALLGAIERLSGSVSKRVAATHGLPVATGGSFLTASPAALAAINQGAPHFARREYIEAARFYRQATQLDSTSAFAWLLLAWSDANAGVRRGEQLRAYQRAYSLRGTLRRWYEQQLVVAEYYSEVGREREAIAVFDEVERRNPKLNFGVNNKALSYRALRQDPLAERLFASLNDSIGHTVVFANLVSTIAAQGRVAEAESLVVRAARVNATSSQLISGRRTIAYAKRDYPAVVTLSAPEFDRTSKSGSSTALGHATALEAARTALGQFREVEAPLQYRLSRLDQPEFGRDYLVNLANRRTQKVAVAGGAAEAIREIEGALARHPLDRMDPLDRPYSQLARFFAIAGQPARARSLISERNREVPEEFKTADQEQIEEAAGHVAMAEGKFAEALAHFRAADVKGCATCWLPFRALAHDRFGQADSAMMLFQRYLDTPDPRTSFTDGINLAHAYRRLGELHEAKGEKPAAIRRYQQFVDLWKDADPELQEAVRDVRARIVRLQRSIG